LTDAGTSDLVSQAVAAWEGGDRTRARSLLDEAVTKGNPHAADVRGFLLATSDPVGAERDYRVAIASGEPKIVAQANMHLGLLLGRKGDFAGAKEAFLAGIAADDPMFSPECAYNLGIVSIAFRDFDGAERFLQQATASQYQRCARDAEKQLRTMRHYNRLGIAGRWLRNRRARRYAASM
jgi:Tfp pilus assembly protein PilF